MQDFLNKLSKSAATAANRAGNKAGEILEVGKLKNKISSKTQDIGTAKKEIGAYCYQLYKDGKIEDPAIKKYCETIAECNAEIDELEQQIKEIKEEYRAKNEDPDPTL